MFVIMISINVGNNVFIEFTARHCGKYVPAGCLIRFLQGSSPLISQCGPDMFPLPTGLRYPSCDLKSECHFLFQRVHLQSGKTYWNFHRLICDFYFPESFFKHPVVVKVNTGFSFERVLCALLISCGLAVTGI